MTLKILLVLILAGLGFAAAHPGESGPRTGPCDPLTCCPDVACCEELREGCCDDVECEGPACCPPGSCCAAPGGEAGNTERDRDGSRRS